MRTYNKKTKKYRPSENQDSDNSQRKKTTRSRMKENAIKEGLAHKQIDKELDEEEYWTAWDVYNEIND